MPSRVPHCEPQANVGKMSGLNLLWSCLENRGPRDQRLSELDQRLTVTNYSVILRRRNGSARRGQESGNELADSEPPRVDLSRASHTRFPGGQVSWGRHLVARPCDRNKPFPYPLAEAGPGRTYTRCSPGQSRAHATEATPVFSLFSSIVLCGV